MAAMPLHGPAVWQLLAFIAGFAIKAADASCKGVPLPPLPTCFRDQPSNAYQSCYKVVESNGSMVQCAYVAPGYKAHSAAAWCKNGQWSTGNSNTCDAAPRSAWRIVNDEPTMRGWWLHELKFYTDSSCRTEMPAGAMRVAFAAGPAGSMSEEPKAAFDGNPVNYWRAPCAGTDTFDFCGCRRDLGEGWSVDDKRCAPGYKTNADSREDCLTYFNQTGTNTVTPLGCPAGGASLGVHFDGTQEIGCVRMLQYDSAALSTTSVSLQTWQDGGWQLVKTFSRLEPGTWQTLHVKKSCPIFELPHWASKWTRTASTNNGGAGDGDTVAVQCVDGTNKIKVTCQDGAWSTMPMISCYQPSIPALPSGQTANLRYVPAEQREHPSEGLGEEVELVLILVGCMCGVAAIVGMMHLGRIYLSQQAWKSLINHSSQPQEPENEAPKLALGFPGSFTSGSFTSASPYGSKPYRQPKKLALDNRQPSARPAKQSPTNSARAPPLNQRPPVAHAPAPPIPAGRPVAHGAPVTHGPPGAYAKEDRQFGDSWRGGDRRWGEPPEPPSRPVEAPSSGRRLPATNAGRTSNTNRPQMPQSFSSWGGEPAASNQQMRFHTPEPSRASAGSLRDTASSFRDTARSSPQGHRHVVAAPPPIPPPGTDMDVAVRQTGQSWRASRQPEVIFPRPK